VSGAAHGAVYTVGDTAHDAVQGAREQAQGNPLAAGLVAFGVGWLVSSLLPASETEKDAVRRTSEQAKQHAGPVVDQAKQSAQEVGDAMKGQAQEAVEQVKVQAQDAAQTVKQEGADSASTVTDEARAGT
jgi:gas vesicle protein